MLSQVSVVQPPNWSKDFHVFVDTSDVAIDSIMMQIMEPKWYMPETLPCGTELPYEGTRGLRNGIQCDKVPTLPIGPEVFIPR